MTSDAKYSTAVGRFSQRIMIEAMASGNDSLDNKHASTQILRKGEHEPRNEHLSLGWPYLQNSIEILNDRQ